MHKYLLRLAVPIFLIVWLFFTTITIPNYGITWDEPLYYRAAKSYADWFGLIFSGNWYTVFDAKTIDTYWQYNAQHPPLTKLVAGITYTISHHWVEEPTAFRFAELFWYGVLLLSVYSISRKIYNKNVAWVAMIATALMPRIFADAHLLELDLPLAVVWLLTTYTFYRGLEKPKEDRFAGKKEEGSEKEFPPSGAVFSAQRSSFFPQGSWGWSLLCGLMFGFAMLTKVMAVFIIIPLFLWAQVFNRNKYTHNLFCMVTLGPILFVLFWPWLWHNTFTRILDYFAFFFLMESPLKTYYLGYAYSSTPWHYPIVMTLVTVPIGILLLAIYGGFRSIISDFGFRNAESKSQTLNYQTKDFSILLLFNIFFFLVFFALPGTLAIDGVRYFLPIFPMLAIFAGIGFKEVRSQMSEVRNKISNLISQILNAIVLIVIFLLPLIAIGTYHPYQLSYYNEVVGGLRGATRLGFETTYWGDVIGQPELDWLNKNIPYEAKVKILPVYPGKNAPIEALSYYPDVILYYQNQGKLRSDIKFFSSPPYNYLCLVSRQGLFTSSDWYLYQQGNPMYQTTLSGIPLFSVYKLD
ncbi:MAG: ArnT family glycosyltransferase [bacterium]